MADNLLQLNLLGDAEGIIKEMEKINDESLGKETALLKPLQEKLQRAKNQIPQTDIEPALEEIIEEVPNSGEEA